MAKKNITANKARMFSYAKGGGLKGITSGGGVLDQKQFGGVSKVIKAAVKKVVPKVKKFITDIQGKTYDKDMLKNTGYARQVDLDNAIKNRKIGTGSN